MEEHLAMKVGFEPLSKSWSKTRETYGWLVVDGEKVTKMRKNEDGSVSIYLFSGSGWTMREGEHKKGTVTVRMPSPS